MDRFRSIEVFVKVAEHGSFAAAARSLAMSPPAVTRAVAMLEDRLGMPLFKRTTRSVHLTEGGTRFLVDGQRILAELEEAEAAAAGVHGSPRGELRVTAPVLFGRMFVAPVLGDFLNQYPLVTCQTLFVDRNVNILDEGQDVAVRIGDLPDSSMTAIKVGSVRRVVIASPDYIKCHGLPKRPQDLSSHRTIHSTGLGVASDWLFQEKGKAFSLHVSCQLRMNTNDAAIELVQRGWGICQVLSYQVSPSLADKSLQTVLDQFELPPLPIHILHHEGRNASARIRAFVDYSVERLRSDRALNPNTFGGV